VCVQVPLPTKHHEHSAAIFSQDGLELFWTLIVMPLQGPAPSVIMHMRCVDGRWSRPEVASFSGRYGDSVGFFSPDGDALYFNSNRPASGSGPPMATLDLWMVTRTRDGWSSPTRLDPPINTPGNETSAQSTRSGTLYMYAYRPGFRGYFRARAVDGRYEEPEPLGPTINSEYLDWCHYVDPDERYIIFASDRPGGHGRLDLYISFAQPNGAWGEAINLGPNVNSEDNDRFPCVSPDGRYLFFLSKRTPLPEFSPDRLTHVQLVEMSESITNGLSNIYWIDAGFVQYLTQDEVVR
jgi:hypothetical protein